jgi:integrase
MKKKPTWPKIYPFTYPSKLKGFMVDLRAVGGRRPVFPTKIEAETRAEQARIEKANQGTAAFALPLSVKLDASKANAMLAPHGVTILEAAKFYQKNVLAYKTAPTIREIVQLYIDERKQGGRRPDTIRDLKHRMGTFAEEFGDERLHEISLDELKDFLGNEEWEPVTRNGFRTKISQLYNFAIAHEWIGTNLIDKITSSSVDETTPEIFTVSQAEQLLIHAHEFGLLPYVAIGLFAGIRKAEIFRLNWSAFNFEAKNIAIGGDVAKLRMKRNIPMEPALLAWLEPYKDKRASPVMDQTTFYWRKNMEQLKDAAGIKNWPANGLRHSFGSYHYEMFSNENETSKAMGNSPTMIHNHYKALVPKTEAEKFWNLRPQTELAA